MSFLTKILGNPNKRILQQLSNQVGRVNVLEEEIKLLTDEQFKAKTKEYQERLRSANGDSQAERDIMEEILPKAFAVMREAMRRVWGERHYDVQIMGGVVLHQGKIAEMKTGEGKTIVATLAIYLSALTGRGAHLVTVNDYLSRRDGEGMGEVFHFLGLSTGVIQSNQSSLKFVKRKSYKHYSEVEGENLEPCSRREAYACDITYGTNNEFGFDYLRDNMVYRGEDKVQRGLYYAIVDEVDSILIDEARTPLIISAPAAESTSMYQQFAALVPKLKSGTDFVVDEKERVSTLTDAGIKKMEELLGIENIYDVDGIMLVHHLEEALKAETLFKKDRDYIVKDGEIIIVDEFTGRLMIGRRYSEGLHQAIEAKEGVEVKQESQTLATISFQNYFRLYDHLAGMTGTAATEAEEFYKIYKLDVVEIPTNRSVVRKDLSDKIYKTEGAKLEAIVADVKARQEAGQPVLVGTVSVEKNERLSKLLKKNGVKHEVLNAKNHDREARIIAKAGEKGAVTVATNMAGRGTDIKLAAEVKEHGGLAVIGTERHEARRIDNQLRGRSGRQGDPGLSQFYVSLEDDLMRIFGGDRIKKLMTTLGLPDDMPIENAMISKSIESAQKKVEGHNFDIRKHLVEYDDVLNKHREVIYRKRNRILGLERGEDGATIKEDIIGLVIKEIEAITAEAVLGTELSEEAKAEIAGIIGTKQDVPFDHEEIHHFIKKLYEEKENSHGEQVMREIERAVYLRTIDLHWIEHLTTIEELRTGIGLRGYAQTDPLVEYKQAAYRLFTRMLKSIESGVARAILNVTVQRPQPVVSGPVEYQSPDPNEIGGFEDEKQEIATEKVEPASGGVVTTVRTKGKTIYDRAVESTVGTTSTVKGHAKVGRNDPCPCGSGKKFKKCHGK